MKTILASDPQMPVSRVLATHQSSRRSFGRSSSSSRIGVRDSPTMRLVGLVRRRPAVAADAVEQTLHSCRSSLVEGAASRDSHRG